MDRNMRDMDEDDYGQREFVSDDEESDDDDLEDMYSSEADSSEESEEDSEDEQPKGGKRKAPRRDPKPFKRPDARDKRGRPKLEVEYEQETEPLTAEQVANW